MPHYPTDVFDAETENNVNVAKMACRQYASSNRAKLGEKLHYQMRQLCLRAMRPTSLPVLGPGSMPDICQFVVSYRRLHFSSGLLGSTVI